MDRTAIRDSRVAEILSVLAHGQEEQVSLPSQLCAACLSALPASGIGAALMTADGPSGVVLAATDKRTRQLEELQNNEGPCLDYFRSGRPVARDEPVGHALVVAVVHRTATATRVPLGALNLFRLEPGLLSEADLGIGQAMADIATVGFIQERSISASELLATQLQTALTSRVQLEEAKGMLAQRTCLPLGQAFQLMRDYARNRGRGVSDVAAQIIDGSIGDEVLRKRRRTRPNPPQA